MQVSIEITGGAELNAKLLELGGAIARKIGQAALRKAGRPILDAACRNATSMVGGSMGWLLAHHMELRPVSASRQRRGRTSVRLQMSKAGSPYFVDISRSGRASYIPSAIEYGHVFVPRGAAGQGAKRRARERREVLATHRRIPAIPFMRTAVLAGEAGFFTGLILELRRGIEQHVKKAARQAERAAAGGGT